MNQNLKFLIWTINKNQKAILMNMIQLIIVVSTFQQILVQMQLLKTILLVYTKLLKNATQKGILQMNN